MRACRRLFFLVLALGVALWGFTPNPHLTTLHSPPPPTPLITGLTDWHAAVAATGQTSAAAAAAMNAVNPKYVPREWMLVEAYKAAERRDHAPLQRLHQLFKRPYDEQPDAEALFYRRAPDGVWRGKAGVTKMT